VTDLVTKSDSATGQGASASPSEPPVQWAPAAPAPRKRRLWLWIGVPAALLVAGVAAASALLIAPGTSVAGVGIGFLTPGAAKDAIAAQLERTSVTIDGATLTGGELGASVDAAALADEAFAARPFWNVTSWFGEPVPADVTVEAVAATTALQGALGERYIAPTPATVAFDGAGYAVTPAVDGQGVDIAALEETLQSAFADGRTATEMEPVLVAVPAVTSTENAQVAADTLNGMLGAIGFYVGEERTVPVDPAVAASWLTVSPDDETGEFVIEADAAQIQAVVDALPAAVNREPSDGTAIVNSSGTVLDTSTPGLDGRVLGDTSSIADDFAAQLASGQAAFALPVEVTPATTTTLERLLEVDVSEQRLYLKENGAVVDSWLVSSGRVGADTEYGRYRIGWKTPVQTMRGTAADSGVVYEQPDVRWAMYFNGDQAFHGVYWHSNWGSRMSAGCVGMPNSRAEQIYTWAPEGTDVWIHD
jgi:lipoprotein-anchoring transpeptidase ErfK/SrfK